MSAALNFHVDDIDSVLAADFDGSLSGLGMEPGTASFNMSDAILALPIVPSLKHEKYKENGFSEIENFELLSVQKFLMERNRDVFHCNESRPIESPRSSSVHSKKTRLAQSADEDVSNSIKRFCVSSDREDDSSQNSRCRHSNSVPDLRVTGSQPSTILSGSMLSQMLYISDPPTSVCTRDVSPTLKNAEFQYVLGAATALATKIHEETMTYLNQGQPYEIKLKKLGDLTEMTEKKFKSTIRVGFQERRLQYMEKEQIIQWQRQHRPGERIIEIDIPLSYGVLEVINDPNNVHMCDVIWEPTKETGVFVKVNCISTEFTPKKHGGEKGVPFRIQIETFLHGSDFPQRLHGGSCQVKVFKPKGADRKHKTDRDKMSRKPPAEQDKFKPSYDCTVFTECNLDSVYSSPPLNVSSSSTTITTNTSNFSSQNFNTDSGTGNMLFIEQNPSTPGSFTSEGTETPDLLPVGPGKSPPAVPENLTIKHSNAPVKEEFSFPSSSVTVSSNDHLSSEASATETAQWLHQHRFSNFVQIFSSFSGADILRLTRDDLIQICGLADGIRLYNVLHSKAIRPRRTIYVCSSSEDVFRAIYLENLSTSELKSKFSLLLNLPANSIHDIYITGPSFIRVVVTDEVVQNMSEESMFIIEILKDHSSDACRVLLKPYAQHS